MKRRDVAIGAIYGRWTVIADLGLDAHHNTTVLARCVCGSEKQHLLSALVLGSNTKACRRCAYTEHGHNIRGHATYLYRLWSNIKKRCENPRNPKYAIYGARGIVFYRDWSRDFKVFLRDILASIGERPSQAYTLDRIDNEQGYVPGNLRWATKIEQGSNTRLNRFRTLADKSISMAAIARYLAMDDVTLLRHFRRAGVLR
jgi:hypothetical protein